MKILKNVVALILALSLFIVFSGTGFASDVEYVDADTAFKEYAELFAKYYPDEVTIGTDKSKYTPIEKNKFYEDLNSLEEKLKKSVLPENNIKIVYDENNKITSIAYPMRYSKEAQKYVAKYKQQSVDNSSAQLQRSTVAALGTKYTKDVRTFVYYNVIDIPWTPSPIFQAGYNATFHLASQTGHIPTKWFTSSATNFTPYIYYRGAGNGSVTIDYISQSIIDSGATDRVDATLTIDASVEISGIPSSLHRQIREIKEWRAATLW